MARKKRQAKGAAFVLDCSVTMAWFFKDEADPYATAVEKSLVKMEAWVPALWSLEVANAIAVSERRGRSTEAWARKWLLYLQRLPIQVEDQTGARAWSDILPVARAHGLSAYGVAYLELAIREGLPLATLDERLRGQAMAAGVEAFQP